MSCKKNKPALNFFLKTNPLSVRRAWNPSTTSTWPCPCQELLPRRIKTTFEFVASVCFQTKSKTDFNSNLDRKPPKSPIITNKNHHYLLIVNHSPLLCSNGHMGSQSIVTVGYLEQGSFKSYKNCQNAQFFTISHYQQLPGDTQISPTHPQYTPKS